MERHDALTDERLVALAREHGTPLFVYDAGIVRARVAELRGRFDTVRYAQKANPARALLRLLRAEGCAVDAVSAGEVEGALAAGFQANEIVFTADLFDRAALATLARHRVGVNLGSAEMIETYAALGVGREITLRVNPGFGAGHGAAVRTGGEQSKHGIWHVELERCIARARAAGLAVTGLHVHVGSGADRAGLLAAARAMQGFVRRAGGALTHVSAGGGLPVPYRRGAARLDLDELAGAWRAVVDGAARELDRALRLEVEPGRYLVAEAGVLVTEVCATKRNGACDYVLVDAGFNNLPRPMLYGAHHEIDVLGAPPDAPCIPQVVAGPLCESADVFTRDETGRPAPRSLPRIARGDFLCLRDAGAYAASMASNYNGQPLAAAVLVDGRSSRPIQRRQDVAAIMGGECD